MKISPGSAHLRYAATAILAVASVLAITARAQKAPANPWTAAQVSQPSELAADLSSGATPVMLQVGRQVLYKSKHIRGSIYAGPGSTPEGLQALKQAVRDLPKNADIYLYCGCCPVVRCPNIRPAFATLTSMGFTHLHVVMLETSFGQDWVARGYPVAGESAPAH
jgi:hypothetical protein